MTPDISALEARLVAACDAAMAQGMNFLPHTWGVYRDGHEWKFSVSKCCCPLGALLVAEQDATYESKDRIGMLLRILGSEIGFLSGIVTGFDGGEIVGNGEAYALGARLRAKYVEGAL